MRASRRLLLIFTVTILVPGLILGILGVRALTKERRLAEQQVRDRLNEVAKNSGLRLELELKKWQTAVDELSRSGSADPARWPERVRDAVAEPGAAAVLTGSPDRPQVHPSGQLLYELSPLPEDELPPAFAEAEALEFRNKQKDRAIELYRQLRRSGNSSERTRALNGLARTLANAGRIDEALRTYKQLEQDPPIRIGPLPSDLLALFNIASLENESERSEHALHLYRGLVAGRWRMEKELYAYYSDQARKWIPQSAETIPLMVQEDQKLALSIAAERFTVSPRTLSDEDGSSTMAFWHSEPFAALVLGPSFVREHLLPAVDDADLQANFLSPGRESAANGQPTGMYTIKGEWPITLQVRAKDPARLYSGVTRQQNLYLGMLAVVVALLAFGGYFTMYTLKSELAVAQLKSDFVATVSHEFRSPLAGINQLGEMLRDGRIEDEARRQEYYGMIVAETQRLRRLVENVLDFARMEDGRKQYRFEPVEPSRWLQEVAEDFQGEVSGRGFAVEAHIPQELPAIVGDRETLTTAVHNLLDNAVKYSQDSHTVRLEASASDTSLSISVSDRGVGIRAEDRPRIFERFYRGGGDLARRVKGVGLGLNLVQHIVLAHGGTIDVDSKEGEGSTFTIRLKTAGRPI